MSTVNIIVGATSGLGWYLTQLSIKSGEIACAYGRRFDRLQGLRASICESKEENDRLLTHQGDITHMESLSQLFSNTLEKYGCINRIIICSGQYITTAVNTPIDEWKKVFDTNFWGAVNCIHEIVNRIKNGIIKNKVTCVAMTSSLANNCAEGSAAYSCSKSALQMYIKALALDGEVLNSILCYAVQVPPFRSEMNNTAKLCAIKIAGKMLKLFSQESKNWHGRVIKLK